MLETLRAAMFGCRFSKVLYNASRKSTGSLYFPSVQTDHTLLHTDREITTVITIIIKKYTYQLTLKLHKQLQKCIILLPSSFHLTDDTRTQTCSRLIQTAAPPGVATFRVHQIVQMNTKICTGIPTQIIANLKQEANVRAQFNKVYELPLFLPAYPGKQQVSEEPHMSKKQKWKDD